MNIEFSKYGFLLFLALFIVQPVFAQAPSFEVACNTEDIDDDDDGLIELCYLEDMDAIRHNLNGTSLRRGVATLSTGCPTDGCNGYELVGDLNFTTTQSYMSGVVNDNWVLSDDDFAGNTKQGWQPIGFVTGNSCSGPSDCFAGVFEGNGYHIFNLQINRDGTSDVGLFAGNTGIIRNLGLLKIRVEGDFRTGGLSGRNEGRLINVYTDGGRVTGAGNSVALLVGANITNALIINSYVHGTVSGRSNVGGVCGFGGGSIINSYANADISGDHNVGGLIGEGRGSVINSYAAGSVSSANNRPTTGGLIGQINDGRARISNSYSIAEVGSTAGGGLVGGDLIRENDSYWDIMTSGRTTSTGGTSRTTAQLQMPTNQNAAMGIYANWSSDNWDFGTTQTYAVLRYARGGDSNNPACDADPDTPLPRCGALLSGQIDLRSLAFEMDGEALDNARVFRDRSFSPVVFNYDIKMPPTTRLQLRPDTFIATTMISVFKESDVQVTDYFAGKRSGELSDDIMLQADTTEVLRITAGGVTYTLNIEVGPEERLRIVRFDSMPEADDLVDERQSVFLMVEFADGGGNYQYSLRQGDTVVAQGQGTIATITVTVPDNFVVAERTTQSIVYTITVDDGFDIVSTTLMLTVSKEDNGAPQLELDVGPTELSITSVADDPDGVGTFSYRWQRRDEGDSDWSDISVANPYMVSGTTASTIRYRAIVNHTDGQGHPGTYRIGPFPIDVDGDDDGLIDVYYLEDLDAIRNQPDGSGYGLAAADSTITSGCPADTCAGYELLRDLDFTTTRSYVDVMSNRDDWTVDDPAIATDTGWLPIASVDAPFTSLFNGNNNNISNLQINRDTVDDASIGLFAALSSSARLENVGLLNVAIEGRGSVGSLVAQNKGTIANSYVQGGEVTGTQHSLGGLVASNSSVTSVVINSYANVITTSTEVFSPGGLVGRNRGVIRNSYAAGDVGGPCDVGGLVAESFAGSQIVNSYASGNVHRTGNCMDDGTLDSAGGLVGYHRGLLKNSYASGRVSGSGAIGGLVGDAENSTVTSSYWDSTVNSDITADDEDGIATSTVVLQTPQSATGIYADWSSDDWDFGTAMQYPLLRYTSPTDIAIAAVCDDDLDTALPPCGSVLLAQGESGLSNLLFFIGSNAVAPDPPFSLSVLSGYTVTVENINTIELLPYGINPQGESITIGRVGDQTATDYFEGKRSGERSLPIPLPGGVSTLEIVVGTDTDNTDSVTYRITVINIPDQVVVQEIIAPDRVSEGDTINLSATVMGGAISGYMYQWTSTPTAFLVGQDRTSATLSFNVPTDFVARDDTGRDVEITLTVNDGFTSSSATRTVTVAKVDNGEPSFIETVTVSSVSIAIMPGSDTDGDGVIDSYTWQRYSVEDTEWTTIADQTSATLSIPTQDNGGTLYRVQVISTDAQGYGTNTVLGPYRTDIDDDDDGLIDIYYLEDLDAVRHQTDGSGYGATDITRGCPSVGGSEACMGYELRRDLDFVSTPSYVNVAMNRATWTVDNFATAGDSGWEPIGSVAGNSCSGPSDCFAGVFEGNGYHIFNLQINRDGTSDVGLFAGNTGIIRNLGLLKIRVEGDFRTGGLAGRNEGRLMNVYTDGGRVTGAGNSVALLVGANITNALIINSYVHGTVSGRSNVGGVCGFGGGSIINSYANADISGDHNVGGLIGEGRGSVINSYAAGSVLSANNRPTTGGLIGQINDGRARISNSYSIAEVGSTAGGGLVGGDLIRENDSYWDIMTSGRTTSTGGTGRTTAQLQMPTNQNAAMGIYANWSSDNWDFGTTQTYAVLRYARGGDSNNPACDADPDTPLPRCGALLSGQIDLRSLAFEINGEALDNARVFRDRSFSPVVFNYDIKMPPTTRLQLRPDTFIATTMISVFKESDVRVTDYFAGKRSGELSDDIMLQADTTEVLRITAGGVTYTLNIEVGPEDRLRIVRFDSMPEADDLVDERQSVFLMVEFADGGGNYQYSLRQGDTVLAQGQGTIATITVTVPDNFVVAERTTQSIVYTITVDDGFDIVSTTLMLTVSKEDNGAPQLELDVGPTELSITSVADDPDGVGTFSYRWQRRDEGDSDWSDISVANPYMVSGTTASTIRYRAIVNHTDGQGHPGTYRIGPFPIDVDGDDDGLIDVYYLEDLDAIRNQPDGSGYGLAAADSKITSGCPADTCAGYELLRDLDFTTTRSYVDVMSNRDEWTVDDPAIATDTGWLPIASVDAPFTSLFNGNNNNISNLQINRDTVDDASIGLFAALSSSARLENVGVLDVAIEGRGSVGSLVAQNKGTIANSYVQGGEITGTQHSLGGLVASNSSVTSVVINSYANVITTSTEVFSPGGLVGRNRGVIRNSYAAGDVGGPCDVGGLVAESFAGSQIVNSYASGNVHRTGNCMDDGTLDSAGGLVGYHRGLLKNSYASGRVSGSGAIGGLVGDAENSTVMFSYWDSTVNSGITADDEDGIATSTVVLQTPQSATGIYADWSSDDWDFGTAMQYPLLRYTSPTDIAIAAVCDDDLDTALPPCGSVLLAQGESGLSNLLFFIGSNAVAPDPPFSLSVLSGYTVTVENINTIELLPYGINPQGESITIGRVGDQTATDYFEGKRSGERSLPIPLPGGVSTLEIVVGTDTDNTDSVTYRITVINIPDQVVVQEIIAPDRVSEGDTINLSATVMGGAISGYMYQWTSTPTAFLAEQDRTAATLSFNVPTDFVARDDSGRDVEITLTVNDGFTSSSATRTVTIAKVDNDEPSFIETVTVSEISIAIMPGSDTDGDGVIDSYTWQRYSVEDTEWTTIADQTSATLSIPTQDNGGTLYRVQVISTDAQGYGTNTVLGPYRTDIDDDDDGLIDIYYLEDLDAVRHQTDGSGYGATDITRGCPSVGGSEACMGYELRRDLDFTTTQSYVDAMTNRAAWTVNNFAIAGNSGWQPIGSVANTANSNCGTSGSDCFASVFEGNGYRISNLQINRDNANDIGLFAGNRNIGTIRNLGLREIEVEGNTRVGGLVGRNEGNLINTYVVDSRVDGSTNNAGLLVGVSRPSALIINSYVRGTVEGFRWVGGICGLNFGRIINSYAEVMARGAREVGGLAAENQGGTIRNSYAMGSAHITASESNRRNVGGLLAIWRDNDAIIANSYSTVAVTAVSSANNIGGLIGGIDINSPPLPANLTASYWDTDTSGQTASPAGGTSQTMSELITPTAPGTSPTAVYYQWSTADWDFGTPEQYPALLYSEVAGVNACDTDAVTPLPRCGHLLPGQRAETARGNTTPTITTTTSSSITVIEDAVTILNVVVDDEDDDVLRISIVSSNDAIATAMVSAGGNTRVLEIRGGDVGNATLTVTVDDGRGEANSTASLVFNVSVLANPRPMITLTPSTDQSLPLGTMSTAMVSVVDNNYGDGDTVTLTAMSSDATIVSVVEPSTINGIADNTTSTFTLNALQGGMATITFTAEDSNGLSDSVALSVRANAPPTLSGIPGGLTILTVDTTTSIVVMLDDANTDDTPANFIVHTTSDTPGVAGVSISVSGTTRMLAISGESAGSAMITVTVDDGRGLANSVFSKQFPVQVQMPIPGNAAPAITLMPSVDRTLLLNSTAHIVVSVADSNYGDGDTVALEAMSSDPTIVSVIPPTIIGIADNTASTFTLNALRGGVATITFTATDSRGSRDSVDISVRVNAPLTGTVGIEPDSDDRWQLRAISMFADANGIATTSHEWFRVTNGRAMRVGSAENYTIPESNVARAAQTSYRLVVTVIDNIEQSSTLTAAYTVPNIAPMITQVNVVPSTTTEGRTVRMTATASDENFDGLDYRWRVSGINADATDVSGETAPLTIRDYFVTDATADTATAIFVVAVSDGTTTTIGRFSVVVNKEDNGAVSVDNLARSSTTETRLIFTGIDETTETDGGVRGAVTYHWQQCLGSLGRDCSTDAVWQNIDGQTGTLGDNAIFYEVPDMLSQPENHQVISGDRFRVRIAYTDLQAYMTSVYSSNLGARLGQNTTPTIRVDDTQATDITLLEGGRITVPVSVRDRDGSILNVAVVSTDEAIASTTISGDGATRTLEIVGVGTGETMITATVDDGTGEANATASIVFNVMVVENTAPTLVLETSSAVTLPVDDTTDIVASVADSNFDLDDVVTLTAVSSTPSVVSVMPERIDITTDTSATFVLNAEQGGVSMITFTATDRDGLETRAELAVRVNTAPTLSGIPSAPFRLLEGVRRELVLTIADADNILAIRIDTDDSMIATATIIATSGAMRTLEVRGVGAGNTTITVVVNDGRGVANSRISRQFAVQVEASEAPTIDIVSAPRQAIELGNTADIVVRVSDANFDFGDRVALTAESSSRTIVSVMPQRIDAIGSNMRETLTLSANKAGVAEIILTAIDDEGLRSSETVMVTVNTPPQVRSERVPTRAIIATVGVPFELQTGDFFMDADGDALTYQIEIEPTSSLIDGFSTMTGVWTFTATDASRNTTGSIVTVSADDGRGGNVQTTFTLLIDAPPTAVRIATLDNDRWLLRAGDLTDANGIMTISYRWFINDTLIDGATENEYRIPDDSASRAAGTRYRLEATVVDNIGQSVSTQSNVYTVANESPVIASITDPQTIDETAAIQNITVVVTASDPNYDDLTYSWRANTGTLNDADESTAILVVPPDFVDATSSDTTVNIEVVVSDGTTTATRMTSVLVNKVNNGAITIGASVEPGSEATALTATILTNDPDGNPSDAVMYRWQVCLANADCSVEANWRDIAGATGTPYSIVSGSEALVTGNSLRAQASYTDGQNYSETVNSPAQVYTPLTSAIRIRAKVFLEGPLQ